MDFDLYYCSTKKDCIIGLHKMMKTRSSIAHLFKRNRQTYFRYLKILKKLIDEAVMLYFT